jgi:hypothetical protein
MLAMSKIDNLYVVMNIDHVMLTTRWVKYYLISQFMNFNKSFKY